MVMMKNWCLWFVGLPGSGKSSLARNFTAELEKRGENPVLLQMDLRRKAYFPQPKYTAEERFEAYRLFAGEGADLVARGKNVVLDGTAPQLMMRECARERIAHFAEIFVSCPVDIAMEREGRREQGAVMADLYAKALQRQKTGEQFEGLGEVIGVDVPFEENPKAEFVLYNVGLTLEQATVRILDFFDGWRCAFS